MNIRYVQCGDVYLPDFALPESVSPHLGKYGRLRLAYLKEKKCDAYTAMLLNGTLNAHLSEVDAAARAMLEDLIPSMAKAQGITEALKTADPMAWVRQMNNIKACAEEIVLVELCFGESEAAW
ncbi:MAG: TnpV protein [Faecalibacterium sp.]|jgi:hypothetical protein|nr:TnpV protein [Faecalibacterium sp.]